MTVSGLVQRYFRDVVLTHEGDDCLIWPYAKTQDGYAIVWHDERRQVASRVVCEHFTGPSPTPKHEAAHSCGKSSCVNSRHLSWKTSAENEADKIRHGTVFRGGAGPKGKQNGRAKLTESDVLEIKRLRGSCSRRELAERFGVHVTHIGDIQRGELWGWLDENRAA